MKRLFNVLSLSCFICLKLFSLYFNISGEFSAYIINAFEDAEYDSTFTQIQNDLDFVIFSENNSRLAMQLLTGAQLFSVSNSVNDFLNFQTLLYYADFNRTDSPDTFSFENLNGLLKYDLYHYPFTFSALLYAEGFKDFPFGLSCSFQLFNGIFYLDYLYNSLLVLGARYNLPGAVALNYEYFYNGNNLSDNNLSKHNMFLSLMWNPSFLPHLTIGSQFQLWASSFIDMENVDLVFSPYIGYFFAQNLSGGISMRFPIGKASGMLVNRRQTEVMVELKFRY